MAGKRAARSLPLELVAAGFALLGFALLWAVQAHCGGAASPFDRAILVFLHQNRHPFWNALTYLMAFLGSLWVVFGVAAVAFVADCLYQKRLRTAEPKSLSSEAGIILRHAGRLMPVACVGGTLLVTLAKQSAHRPRPHEFAPLFPATGYSFPSGHAFLGTVIFGLLGYFARQEAVRRGASPFVRGTLIAGFASLIFAVGVSRVYAGVHYPTDVLAGWAGGAAAVLLSVRVYRAE